jgi:hypothetical protein
VSAPVLYLGDTDLATAAAYLGGVLAHAGIPYGYLPSDRSPDPGFLEGDWRLVILSDYAARNFTPGQMDSLTAAVRSGRGLLMIGGWESFQGLDGGYAGTRVAQALPVEISPRDDRVNYPYPCLAVARQPAAHPVLAGLPWDEPPGLGGYNRVALKPGAELLLEAVRFRTAVSGGNVRFREEGRDPLLAVWSFGSGRVTAFCSDAAPHWVGGFVDWGSGRVRAGGPGSAVGAVGEVEVGEHYVRFFQNLIRWTGRL